MKLINLFSFVILSVAFCMNADAQDQITTKQYKEAYKMAEDAKKELLADHIDNADSLIRRSIDIYPTQAVFDYAITLGLMPNIVGANLIMDLAAERVNTSPGCKDDPMGTTGYLKHWILSNTKTVPFDKSRKLFNMYNQAQKVNVILGERSFIISSMQKAIQVNITPYSPDLQVLDEELYVQQVIRVRLALYQTKFDEALSMVENMPLSDFYTKSYKALAIKNVKLDYLYENPSPENNALATTMLKGVTGWEYSYFGFAASIGNNDDARQYYALLSDQQKNFPTMPYYLAMMDITDGHYSSAITKLKIVLDGYRTFKQEENPDMIINRHLLYKAFGDAYAGLKLYDKAKDSYRISLFYYPGYKIASKALTDLEVKLAEASATDKNPPVVTILEPAFDAQMKFTVSETTVMIKGHADDLAGIREVSINGQKVYTQKGGDFWGDVNLNEGWNELELVVTGSSGFKAIKKFTIIRTVSRQNTEIIPVTGRPGQNYCLLIAAQNYTDPAIPSLDHPIADAVKLKLALKSFYDFPDKNIISLFNPQTSDIRRQLLELSTSIQPEDNLVIFYAGHGIWVDSEKKGYWLMTDATYKDHSTWLPNKDMLDMIAKIPARHTLLITDACFSGSVFKSRGLSKNMPAPIREMSDKITRVAITSGNDTEVPDESVFMKYLIKALNENKAHYLTAQKMFINDIIEEVMSESKTEPRYGTLESAGHVGGDFVFTLKGDQ